MEPKISVENPPHGIRELCELAFNLEGLKPCWTFGDTIYNPHKGALDRALLVHEVTHMKQQQDTPVAWWHKYLQDEHFRYEQELEAYKNQYIVYTQEIKDKNALFRALYSLATDLSGPMYGNVVSKQRALSLIKNKKLSTQNA